MAFSQQHFNHAWDHFRIHSAQRMQHWQFALAFSGAIYAVIAAAAQFNARPFIDTAAVTGLVATAVFWALDRRTRDLVHAAEDALKEIELDLAGQKKDAPIAIFHRSEHHSALGLSYTQAFSLLFLVNALAFTAVAFGEETASALQRLLGYR